MGNAANHIVNEIQTGLLQWYPFAPKSSILFIGTLQHPVAAMLSDSGQDISCVSLADATNADWAAAHQGRFDYVASIADLELLPQPTEALKTWKSLLRPDGKLLLGMNNRLGLRYFCGDRDIYTGRNFDGIENYRHVSGKADGRMYSRAEIAQMLRESGWQHFRFYSVLSDLQNPALIYAEDFLPNEDLANRLFPTYHSPDTVFLHEEELQSDLVENGLFHAMANAYLVECSPSGDFSNVLHVTCSTERGKDNAFFTIIHRSGQVEKRAIYPEGRERLQQLADNMDALRQHGVPVINGKLEGDSYVTPYVEAPLGQIFLKQLIRTDTDKFLEAMDSFHAAILQSSDIVTPDKGDGEGPILSRGYWDMVPLNSFYIDGKFVFFDQEFSLAPCPANFVIYRAIAAFYSGNPDFEKFFPMRDLLARYGLLERLEQWQRMAAERMISLRQEKELALYHEKVRRNDAVVAENRERMGYSHEEYQRIFADIFRDAARKEIVLFGSGRFAKRYLASYGKNFPVCFIVDNNNDKWGQAIDGVPIKSPDALSDGERRQYKVMICIRDYAEVERQLRRMGITDYSVFVPDRDYPLMRQNQVVGSTPPGTATTNEKEKYHVGYIAGVFDLFHIGHLNLFRRAKEQCNYLIVGVVSDRGVTEKKGVELFVPFEERAEMVRACRYVDEVVEIPFIHCDTKYAWNQYHFDVQFSGSDYEHDPGWLEMKAFLEARGATMVFFPYTESTSSTKLKKLIEKKLL